MKNKFISKFFKLFFIGIGFLIGIGLLFLSICSFYDSHYTIKNFNTCVGIIFDIDEERYYDSSAGRYSSRYDVYIRYNVDGITYEYLSEYVGELIESNMEVGDKITLYYDKNDPTTVKNKITVFVMPFTYLVSGSLLSYVTFLIIRGSLQKAKRGDSNSYEWSHR